MTKSDLVLRLAKGVALTHGEHDANFQRLMYWSGKWTAGTYEANEVVVLHHRTWIANKTTTEEPRIINNGAASVDLPDAPVWDLPALTQTGEIVFGSVYTITSPGYFNGFQAWLASTSSLYKFEFYFQAADGSLIPISTRLLTTTDRNAWVTIADASPIVLPGDVLIAVIRQTPTVGAAQPYESIAGNWPAGNPSWATVQGYHQVPPAAGSANNNAYGVRGQFQPVTQPLDWDVLAI